MQVQNYLWIALWVCFTTLGIAQPEIDFDKANQEYRNENYENAAKLYESVLDQGKHSVDLYFNLGNTYYKLNQLAPSIYYYEKGLQLDPKNKDILNNIQYAQQATVDAIKIKKTSKIKALSKNFLQILSFNTWAVLAIICSIIAAAMFLIYYFTKKPILKRIWFIGSLFFIVSMLFTLLLSYNSFKLSDTNYAIVWDNEVEVRDAPTSSSTRLYYLHEGTKVSITYEEDNWARIMLTDGNEGWIQKQQLKKL